MFLSLKLRLDFSLGLGDALHYSLMIDEGHVLSILKEVMVEMLQ